MCETCARYKSEKDVYNSGTGIFGLPEVENDVELNDLNRTNRWFSNLKVNIRRHVDIKTHVDAKDYFLSIEERKFKLRNKNLSAAINVVRTAYVSLKLGDSFASITSRLANLSLAGAQVGHKNHSYRIPPEVVDETALVIEEHINRYLIDPLVQTNKPPWFGLITDKITTGQRTRQMTSARLVNISPDDPTAPLIINIYLGHPACDDKSGSGLAQNIIDLLIKHKISSRHTEKCFAGFCIDGEYVNLAILRHFVDLNLINKAVGKHYEIWDPAHVIERAVLDGFKKAPFLEKNVKWLQEIVKAVQYGNSYEYLIKAAETIELALLKPKIFKSKKFVVDCEKVYRSFFNNYRAIAAALQGLLPDNTAESCLRHMTDKNFILSVAFLSCVCSILAAHSSNFQRYDSLISDLFNNHDSLVERLDELLKMISSESFAGCFYMKTYNDARDQLEKGEFNGIPTIGRNTLWNHYRSLVIENIFAKFKQYVAALKSGFVRRLSSTLEDDTLRSYAGFLNLLAASISPHTFHTYFNPEVLEKIMNIPARNMNIVTDKMCGYLTSIAKKCKGPKHDLSFNAALRLMLINPKCYENLPTNVVDGLIMVLTIPVSEAIAETQGSSIDALHIRYKNTDKDDTRLQNELRVRLMGPEACSEQGEKLVEIVAKRLANRHGFLNVSNKIGPAITNVLNKGYSMPFKF